METAKYVIVGSGIAGTTAAATIRQHDPDSRIMLIGREPHPLYSRTSLVPYMRAEVSRDNLVLREDAYYKKHSIDFLPNRTAISIDPSQNIIQLTDGAEIEYQKLLIATGSRPKAWNIPGSTLQGVYSLRTIDDADHILKKLKQAKQVIIIGGGFITLELIQLLSKMGISTHVVVRGPYYWSNVLDQESGQLLQQLTDVANVTIHYNARVDEVVGAERVESVILSNGRQYKADIVLANIGIDFNTDWLSDSGIDIERGVVVDQYLQTNIKNIYAAGDIALFYDPLIGMYHQQGNWNNATIQGQIAGQNMSGHKTEMAAVTTYSINYMGTDISFLGQTSQRASIITIPRGSARSGSYGRILVSKEKVIGATLINRFADRSAISRLISSQVNVSTHHADLADESVSLNHIAEKLGA